MAGVQPAIEFIRQLAVGQMFAMHTFRALDDDEMAEEFVHAAADMNSALEG